MMRSCLGDVSWMPTRFSFMYTETAADAENYCYLRDDADGLSDGCWRVMLLVEDLRLARIVLWRLSATSISPSLT
jgi:hypothetical protein